MKSQKHSETNLLSSATRLRMQRIQKNQITALLFEKGRCRKIELTKGETKTEMVVEVCACEMVNSEE